MTDSTTGSPASPLTEATLDHTVAQALGFLTQGQRLVDVSALEQKITSLLRGQLPYIEAGRSEMAARHHMETCDEDSLREQIHTLTNEKDVANAKANQIISDYLASLRELLIRLVGFICAYTELKWNQIPTGLQVVAGERNRLEIMLKVGDDDIRIINSNIMVGSLGDLRPWNRPTFQALRAYYKELRRARKRNAQRAKTTHQTP